MSDVLIIHNNQSQSSLSLDGGNVLSWKVHNPHTSQIQDILYQGSSERRGGIPLLFPFANPLHNNTFDYSQRLIGQHGFARDSKWVTYTRSDNTASIRLTPENLTPEMHIAYPFDFECTIKVTLPTSQTLQYTISVLNLGNVAIPIAPGLHPYFPLAHVDKNDFKILHDQHYYPINDLDWNKEMEGNFYDWNSDSIECIFPNMRLKIQELSNTKCFENIVIWSQTPNKQDSNFVCIEPFTRTTNAINDNPILVLPQQSWTATLEFTVTF